MHCIMYSHTYTSHLKQSERLSCTKVVVFVRKAMETIKKKRGGGPELEEFCCRLSENKKKKNVILGFFLVFGFLNENLVHHFWVIFAVLIINTSRKVSARVGFKIENIDRVTSKQLHGSINLNYPDLYFCIILAFTRAKTSINIL